MTSPHRTEIGWTRWYGGSCPVPAEARVAIKTRIDEQFEAEDGEPVPDREGKAGRFYWRHAAEDEDIVAYRLLPRPLQQEEKTP